MAKKIDAFWVIQSKIAKQNGAAGRNLGGMLEDMLETLPALMAFLIGGKIGNEDICGGSMLLFVGDQGPQALLKDRHHQLVAFVTENSWGGLLGAVEDGLAAGSHKWRKDTWAIRQRGARK